MSTTLTGTFANAQEAQAAQEHLIERGIDRDRMDLSLAGAGDDMSSRNMGRQHNSKSYYDDKDRQPGTDREEANHPGPTLFLGTNQSPESVEADAKGGTHDLGARDDAYRRDPGSDLSGGGLCQLTVYARSADEAKVARQVLEECGADLSHEPKAEARTRRHHSHADRTQTNPGSPSNNRTPDQGGSTQTEGRYAETNPVFGQDAQGDRYTDRDERRTDRPGSEVEGVRRDDELLRREGDIYGRDRGSTNQL